MLNPDLHLRISGMLLLGLFLLNFLLPSYFNWRQEFARLSLVNRRIVQVHTMFVAFTVLLMGLLLSVMPNALLEPGQLSRVILIGIGAFWTLRLFVQWFVYDAELWRGKTFETAIQVIFTLLWTYISASLGWALYWNVNG